MNIKIQRHQVKSSWKHTLDIAFIKPTDWAHYPTRDSRTLSKWSDPKNTKQHAVNLVRVTTL